MVAVWREGQEMKAVTGQIEGGLFEVCISADPYI